MLPQVWAEIIGVSRKHAKHVTASSKSLVKYKSFTSLKMPQISKLRLLLYGSWYLFGETRPDLGETSRHGCEMLWGYTPRPLPSWPLLAMTTAFLSRKKTISWQLRNLSVTTCSLTHVHQIYELLIDISFHLSSNSIIYIYSYIYIQWAQHTLKFCMVFVPRLALPNLTFQRFETLDLYRFMWGE